MGAVVHFGNAANMIMYAVNIYKRVAFLSGNATGMIVYAANIQQVAAVLSGNAAAMIKPTITRTGTTTPQIGRASCREKV